ncbi:MAG: PTS mannose transporter subunit IID [Candidatus Makana argininalis]
MNKLNKYKKKITSIDILKVFIRSNFFQGSWNFERMQSLGFCFSIVPIIKRLYSKNKNDLILAMKRHLEFFNTHPYVSAPILGVTIAMEEQRANGYLIKDSSINSIKIGLMGPLAGIGDPIFWGTIRPLLSAIGAGLSINGNLMGPLLFFITFNLVRLCFRYYGILYGYKHGIKIINNIGNQFFKKITEGASILGLFIMGVLVNKWTHVNIPFVLSNNITNEKKITIQIILDQIIPGLIPLLITLLCMWLLKKRINSLFIIIMFFVLSIFGYWLGFLGL